MNVVDDGIWKWIASILAAVGATSLTWYAAFWARCATKKDILDMATKTEVKTLIHEEHGATLATIIQRLDEQDRRLEDGDDKMDALNLGVCNISASVATINGKLDVLLNRNTY